MFEAANLMLDCEKDFITLHIDNILKTPFVRIRVSRKPVAFEQPPIRAGEVGNINLDVMPVVRLDAFGSLTRALCPTGSTMRSMRCRARRELAPRSMRAWPRRRRKTG